MLKRSRHGTPKQAAKKAKQHGVSFVCVLGCWQDEKRGHVLVNRTTLGPYAKAFQAEGIDVWIWGYPHAGWEAKFMSAMGYAARSCGAKGLILDPEKSYKHRNGDAKRLVELAESQNLPYGITSYAVRKFHRDLPYSVFGGHGFGSPQTYTISEEHALEAIDEWRRLGWDTVLPSVPSFGPKSGSHLLQYLENLEDCQGIIVWSWRSMDSVEWSAIEAAAAFFGRDGGATRGKDT